MRAILLSTLLAAVLAAGCAQMPGGPANAPSNAEAAALFAEAAGNVPDKYGVKMTGTRNDTELMSAEAVFDEPAQMSFFTVKMDESLAGGDEGGMGMSFPSEGVSIYTTPQGSAILMGTNVIVMPPDGSTPWASQAEENEGLAAISDPEALLAELKADNVTVNSVTATTLRGKAGLELDATVADEDGPQNVTIWLFQDPTRVARLEMIAPDDEEQMAGALIAMDMLYDDEIDIDIPEGIKRALGLRYESDRSSFGGFGGGGSGGESGAPETWTFQVDGGIALSEVEAQVSEGMGDEDEEPAWTMPFSAGTKTVDAMTITFDDVDGDSRISQGDTLTITRGEGAEHLSVAMKDLVSGYRVTPGAGLLLAVLAAVGAAIVTRRP